jgi:hypothetical protein
MELDPALMAMLLSAACLLIAAVARAASDRQRTRLMMGSGAALGGISLVLLAAAGS